MVGGVRAGFAVAWIAAAAAFAAAAASLLGADDPVAAGWWSLAGGAGLVALASASRRAPRPREHVLTGILDRVADVATLACASAWALDVDPDLAVASLVALVGSTLAAYARARARSLGYLAGEVSQTSFVRVGLVALTLALGWGAAGMWWVAGWSWLLTASRVVQVRKEELA